MANQFAWYEFMTNDSAKAGAFYSAVVGWTTFEVPGGSGYTLFCPPGLHGKGVAGLITLNDEMKANGARPGWIGYIAVDDVDAFARRVVAAGGTMKKAPTDIPGMLRFAVFADRQGAPFILFSADPAMGGNGPPQAPSPDAPGYVGWHELVSTDWQDAWDFYAGLFGWEKDHPMDMGEMGIYQIMRPGTPHPMGAMMNAPQGVPGPFWNYYFVVDSANAAIERLTSAGGKVINGPYEVPGPMWTVQALDNEGAMFSVVSAKP